MRTIRTKVYTFNELNKEEQETAIEKFRNDNYEHISLDMFEEDCLNTIKEKGFKDADLLYSLSYSQGDGLSFNSSGLENSVLVSFFAEIMGENKEKQIQVLIDNLDFAIKVTGRYAFSSASDIGFDLEDYNHYNTDNCNEVVSKVRERIENYYLDLCKELEKIGYAEIEYFNSDEYIKETLIANEYEFLSTGKMFS